ncbi:hypothetical protein [Corynebacterium glutamicum]|uniref:hypothetical protein n=1 Tax=Corynebacterium glutamicum TaxID=1718 RepID=UPI001B8BE12F|nr:hypothetical protein [Corynebacterium glutamicum]
MVLVKIDIKNIASETHPDDKVVFRSPVVREAAGGGLVSTADEVVGLVDGVGELELVPGPVIVTFQCRGMADTRPKRGTVPNSGPVTVADVIGQNFTFTPEVVGAAQTARNQAVQAAADAEAAEVAAEGHAEAADNSANAASGYAQEAKGYRDTASTHAQTATDKAGVATNKASEANTSANTASNHAAAADTARQGAVAAQGLAETARDEAETKVQTALDAALPTKADKVHEHTTAQVTGLDTALAGKAAQTTLDTRLPENLSLRVDTTVGTRIFAGGTMIYGDTGWRDVSGYLIPGLVVSVNNGRARMQRVGNRIEFDIKVDVNISGLIAIFDAIPSGYRPIPRFPMDNGIFTHSNVGGGASQLKAGALPGVFYNTSQPLRTGATTPFPNPGTVAWTGSYATDDQWPSTLIGLPT